MSSDLPDDRHGDCGTDLKSVLPVDVRWHYLHPASLVFRLVGLAKVFVLPALAVLLFSRGEAWEIWVVLFIGPAALYAILRYVTLRYRFAEGELIVQQGFLFRNERHIPFGRIQNIDLVQGICYRLFGVARVRVQTASGSEPEADLDALSLAAVDRLRARVFSISDFGFRISDVSEIPNPQSEIRNTAEPLVHLSPGELLRLGLISGRGWLLIPVALGIAWEFDLYDRLDEWGWFPALWEHVREIPTLIMVAGGIVALIPIMTLLSIIWAFLRMYDFRLSRQGEELRLTCGLLTRRAATVPRHRIQLLSVRETVLHRLLGRVSIRVETASGTGQGHDGNEETAMSQKWLVPLLPRRELPRVLQQIQPELDLPNADWKPLAPKARRRMLKRNLIVAVILTTICTVVAWPWGASALFLFVPLAIFFAFQSAKYTAYARTSGAILFRSGVLTKRVSGTRFARIQVIDWKQSPFDRRYGMASVSVDSAGAGPADHQIAIPYLDETIAIELSEDLYHRAQASEYRW